MEIFDNFCQVTGVDNEVKKDAVKLWLSIDKAIKAEDKPEESQLHWIVCSIYIVVCNKRCLQEKPVTKQRYPTVSELLKAGNLRLVEFFLKMKTILKLDLVSNKVEEPIKRMEKKFLVAAALFSKLKRLWASIVTEETNDIVRAEKFTQCWLLFIVIKAQQPDASCDLMIAFHILLCCINHVTDPSDTSTLTQEKSDSLQRVSSCFGIPFSKIEDVYARYWLPFLKPITEGVSLQSRYQELYERLGDFDERLFLEEDNLLQALPASTNEDDDNGQGEFPSDTLRRFWNSCRTNPTQFVLQLLKASEKVFTAAILGVIGEDQVETTEKLCIQGRKIFFRVMESMLLAEEKRLNCSDFSALLNSKAFNKTLLVCSLEVSLVSSDVTAPELSFPWILSVFDIKPYDFFKVIESFVLHEPHLSSNIRKHLNSIEELIIESLAWKTGSPLIESLKRYNPATSDTTSSRSGQSSTQKCQPLNLFLRKVNQMAYMRLTALCSQLELSEEQVLNTWTCLEHSIRFKWQLFQDRHVDQMILCAIYSISKVLESDIQFKQIVQMYKKLPHSNTQVYKNVRISDDEQDTIIGFYNRVYMPAMKDIILQFTVKKKNPPASPVPQHRSPSRPVPGKKNIYVSPLKKTHKDTLSPATKSLYSFGDLPGSADRASLSRINESMRAENLRTTNLARSAVMKKLRFEDKDISSCSASKDSQQEPSELSRENPERSRAVAEILAPVQISSDGSFTSGSTSLFDNTNSNIIVKDNDNALDC